MTGRVGSPSQRGILITTGTARLPSASFIVHPPKLASHYFQASLPHQFDEYIWFDRTAAVRPLSAPPAGGVPDTHPFGL